MRSNSSILSLAIILLLTIATLSLAGDRRVMIERFTSSTCPPCATYNPNLDAFLNSTSLNDAISISYHMNWPAPGNDPMYWANPNDNNGRRSFYNVNSIPNWKFDGVLSATTYQPPQIASFFEQRKNILSPITIIVYETRNGQNVDATVEIYCESPVANPNAYVRFVVTEKLVTYASPPGQNGETQFHDVMRVMLPTFLGTPVVLLPGKKVTLNYSYTISSSWVADQVKSYVFVQSSPNEILNSGIVTQDFNLISSPSFKTVTQGQSGFADFKAFIPSVANGFNSAVTFTSEVIPANAGISVTFPNGNVLSNYPDSVAFRVTSNSSVPVGEYSVVITGTSIDGKVHKTIVNYLVGKSYVIIGPNRSNVSLSIDNVSYNTSRLFTWDLGSNHSLNAPSPQTYGNNRFIFNNWSNGGTQSHNITINENTSAITANYGAQFRFLGTAEPVGIPVTVGGSSSYYDSASVHNLSLSALQVQFNGKTYYFNRWEGTGEGSYTGATPEPTITMHGVIVQKAIFDTINVGISNYSSQVPAKYELYQNFPNPFNPSTSIRFDIPQSSVVTVEVYDNAGKKIANLVNNFMNAGAYEYKFDASSLSSGVYYYRINAGSYSATKRMLLVK